MQNATTATTQQSSNPMTYLVSMEVPLGTEVFLQKRCGPEFAIEIGIPTMMPYLSDECIWNDNQKRVFERLENLYADKLWQALKRAKNRRELYFNFNRSDFERTGIDRPRAVCRYFLNELCRNNGACPRSNGKFFGMHWDVWGNGAFTTHFTW
jgi:hypothetical protein